MFCGICKLKYGTWNAEPCADLAKCVSSGIFERTIWLALLAIVAQFKETLQRK